MVEGSNLGLFGGQLWCISHPQNQQSQPNPTQTIEATRLVSYPNFELVGDRDHEVLGMGSFKEYKLHGN
jgi:hypothetical protein